jgi:V8-like Glu-specific endopeptidase
MKTKSNRAATRLSVGLLGLLLASLPAAAAAGVVTLSNPHAKAVERVWTAERFAAAQPMPLQQVDRDMAGIPEASSWTADDSAAAASAAGRAPVAGIRADGTNRLFSPEDRELVQAAGDDLGSIGEPASGSAGGYFTSARLVPTSADRSYPYTTVGKLFFHIPNKGDFYCSASVIRARIIATAGQCVHSGTTNPGFYSDFQFVPAYRDGTAPYDTWDWQYVIVNNTWTTGNGKLPNAADYALIELEDKVISGVTRKIGDVVGYLGYVIQRLRPNHAHLLGYPSNFDSGEKLHQVTAQALRAASPNNVEFGSDMRGGSGGGPLIQDFGDNPALAKWIGAISYYNTSTAVKIEGASIPDSRFTGLLNSVCAHRAGNC